MNSIETLVHEHDNILRMLRVVHKVSLSILDGADIDKEDFTKIIDFIRKYADKTHHGKEEDYLFKVITDELGSIGENLVRHGMLVEHDLARLYVSQLEEAVNNYEGPKDKENRWQILIAAGSYEQLLRRHIDKENDVAYPFGAKKLSQKALDWVEEQTNAFETNPVNIKEKKNQLKVLDELEKKYK